MAALFALTLLISSSLLFLIQPMFGRMVLPLLGGTPAVWNTCMLFFQAALLAGYAYSHFSSRYLPYRKQIALHVALLLVPLLVLPVAVPHGWTPPAVSNPIPWLLLLLTVAVGLPFVMVATTAPLIQKWFSHSGHARAGDPYFLYGASNAGSLLALLAYPLFIERYWALAQQGWIWTAGYGALILFTGICGAIAWRNAAATGWGNAQPVSGGGADAAVANGSTNSVAPLTTKRRLRWMGLAAAPSSLMLGATTYITTDVASAPLLWVIPLAAYLLSFVFVFAKRPLFKHETVVRYFPRAVCLLLVFMLAHVTQPISLIILAHTAIVLITALFCHGALAQDRPPPQHLTEFYLWMSIGGVAGGMFNALLAPVAFPLILEYPIALMGACLFLPGLYENMTQRERLRDLAFPLLLGCLYLGLRMGLEEFDYAGAQKPRLILAAGLALLCYSFTWRPQRFAFGVAALFLIYLFYVPAGEEILYRTRSFYGVYRVRKDNGNQHVLLHGTTIHGAQRLEPEYRHTPVSYYYSGSPIGQLFSYYGADANKVAIVGLGSGTVAAFAQKNQAYTFYEIDPVVKWLAFDSGYFTFCMDAQFRGAKINAVLGDARLSLRHAPERHYDLLIVDAFSSDAIPVHLLTREALQLYLSKLADNGIILIHISNRYLELEPVLGNLIAAENLAGLSQNEKETQKHMSALAVNASHWVAIARHAGALKKLQDDGRWDPVQTDEQPVWTDDYSNIVGVISRWW